jgi:hypothetical protein
MTSERKINLVYNKFVKGKDTTNISSKEFYNNLKSQTKSTTDLCVYLTNGTNKRLDNGGSGTTLGFQILSDTPSVGNLFDVSGAKIVFDSSANPFEKKDEILATLSHSDQIWDNSNKSDPAKSPKPIPDPYNGMYAGSVIRVNVTGTTEFPVCGGYHINGIKLDMDKRKEVETNSVGLVKAYYTAIMNDFFTLATATPSSVKHYVLHLAQIPGDLYGGTEITGNAFHTAVTDWIASKTSVAVSMTISIDFVNPGSSKTSPAAAAAVPTPAVPTAAAAATPSVSVEEIIELKTRLDESKSKLAPTASATSATSATAHSDKTAAFNIAQEIFNTFFGGGDVKTNQTKDFLIEKVTNLQNIFLTDPTKKELDDIMKRLDAVAIAPGATSTSVKTKPMKSTKKYVFAFDIDNTLVRAGTNVSTLYDTDERDKILELMNKILVAGYYVWIVTANDNIEKNKFDEIYFKSENGKKIIDNGNYYFMNTATFIKTDFFTTDKISPYVTVTGLDLTFETGVEFQEKCLKPYAMIAKWLQLGNTMDDVQMYLFDDNEGYEKTCKSVKAGKIEFVKISPAVASPAVVPPAPVASPPPSPTKFKSDVLKKATQKFNAIATTTEEATPKAGVTIDTDSPDPKTICSLDGVKDTRTDEDDKFDCSHNFCKKYRKNVKDGGDKYNKKTNVVSACFAILIYDGRDTTGVPDAEHGSIVLADEHVDNRDFHLFGGRIDDKCPLQTLYSEVAEEGRILEIGKKLEDADAKKEFDAIFRDAKGNFLTEPCVYQKALYFIGIIKRDQTSIWSIDESKTGKARYIPGIKKIWTYTDDLYYPINLLAKIFKQINSGKPTGDYERTYGEKNVFGFFSDTDIANPETELFDVAKKILNLADMKTKISEVKKNTGISAAGSSP